MMEVKNIYKAMFLYGYFAVSQSSLRWDIKPKTVIYGRDATLSCNGNGCMPTSIRKWIGGPKDDVLCFNDYSSNPEKYQLMYNKTIPSFDLMIKSFNFTDANCLYTCACGFFQYTHQLQLDEKDFVYPPEELDRKNEQKDGKFYIDMSMKVYPLPNCRIFHGNTDLPVETNIIDVQKEFGINLYRLKLGYALNVEYKNCKANLTLSCKVKSLKFILLQQKLDLCQDHPDSKSNTLLWMLLVLCVPVMIFLLVIYVKRRKKRNDQRNNRRNDQALDQINNLL